MNEDRHILAIAQKILQRAKGIAPILRRLTLKLAQAIKKAQRRKAVDKATKKLQQQSTANTVSWLRAELRKSA